MRFISVGNLGQDDDQGGGQQDEPAEDLGEGVLDLDLHGGGVLRRRRSLRLLKKNGRDPAHPTRCGLRSGRSRSDEKDPCPRRTPGVRFGLR